LIASLRHPSITSIAVDDQARGLAIFGLSQLLGTSGFLVTYCGSRRAPSQGRHDRLLLLAEVFSADRPVAGLRTGQPLAYPAVQKSGAAAGARRPR
jgi:hypothetical protein